MEIGDHDFDNYLEGEFNFDCSLLNMNQKKTVLKNAAKYFLKVVPLAELPEEIADVVRLYRKNDIPEKDAVDSLIKQSSAEISNWVDTNNRLAEEFKQENII